MSRIRLLVTQEKRRKNNIRRKSVLTSVKQTVVDFRSARTTVNCQAVELVLLGGKSCGHGRSYPAPGYGRKTASIGGDGKQYWFHPISTWKKWPGGSWWANHGAPETFPLFSL